MKTLLHNSVSIFVGAFLALCICSCSDEPNADNCIENTPATKIVLSDAQKNVAKSSSTFANDLFNATSQIKKDENFVISPLSASFALSMIANAANGDTRSQILDALHINEGDIDCLNSLNRDLASSLPVSSKCELDFHNSFWYNTEILQPLTSTFTSVLSDCYKASLYGVTDADFINKANSWINVQTNGGIPQFLTPDENNDFILSLFNILNFYGSWRNEGVVPTEKVDFHNANGSTKNLTSLVFDNIFAWSTGHCFVFDIPYVGADLDHGFIFRVIFPYEGVAMDECLSTYKEWLADPYNFYYYITQGGEYINLKVYLPKLEVKSLTDLKPIIEKLGVIDLFDTEKCDLSNATDTKNLFISLLKQYTRIEVDEKGTKAQTVTQMSGGMGDKRLPIPQETIIDRPFAFEIYEASTGVSILQGRINNL